MSSAVSGSEKPLTISDRYSEATEDCPTGPCPSLANDDTTVMISGDCSQMMPCEIDCDPVTSAPTTELFAQTSNCDADAAAAAVTESLIPSSVLPRTLLFRRRWLIIFLFALYSMSNAYQWIHLNIIFDKVHTYIFIMLCCSTCSCLCLFR